jgi:hypothetical protein
VSHIPHPTSRVAHFYDGMASSRWARCEGPPSRSASSPQAERPCLSTPPGDVRGVSEAYRRRTKAVMKGSAEAVMKRRKSMEVPWGGTMIAMPWSLQRNRVHSELLPPIQTNLRRCGKRGISLSCRSFGRPGAAECGSKKSSSPSTGWQSGAQWGVNRSIRPLGRPLLLRRLGFGFGTNPDRSTSSYGKGIQTRL